MPKAPPFDAAKCRDDPRAVARYLNDALSTGDSVVITKAIGKMIRAQGTTKISERAGLRRESLYRTFGGERNPKLGWVITVLQALQIHLVAKPIDAR
jgi:probable addiction module antidote protein